MRLLHLVLLLEQRGERFHFVTTVLVGISIWQFGLLFPGHFKPPDLGPRMSVRNVEVEEDDL